MEILLFWIIFSVLVGFYAAKKGRSGAGFFSLSLLLSPLIGFLIAALVKPRTETVARRSGMKKCPRCAEYVQGEAIVCRYCGNEFPQKVGGSVQGSAFQMINEEKSTAEDQMKVWIKVGLFILLCGALGGVVYFFATTPFGK